jgi:lipopolysaccharide biosynthesis protein
MVGPFLSLADVLTKFDNTAADVWALTDTMQFGHHLQSYFLGFCDGALRDRPIAAFWSDVRDHADKMKIIFENEIGLGTLLREEGYSCEVAFPFELVVQPGHNPVILGWQGLLECGFPFLKREILRDPAVAPLGMSAPRVVKRLFGVDVDEWVGERVAATAS